MQPTAREYSDGTREWCVNGQWHRTDGPAIEWSDGDRQWFLNDQLHRTDGPAIEWADSTCEWFLNGRYLSFNHWLDRVCDTEEERVAMCLRWG